MASLRFLLYIAVVVVTPAAIANAQGIVAVHGLKPGDCVVFQNWNGAQTGTVTEGEVAGGYHVNWNGTVMTVGANSRDIKPCPSGTKPSAAQDSQPTNPPSPAPTTPSTTAKPTHPAAIAAPVQSAFNPHGLKAGTCVQFSYGGGWETATIAGPEYAGSYPVNWGVIKATAVANPRDLRACPAGVADPQATSVAALAKLPTGTGIGAQFGTRNPATCPNRKVTIITATARLLVACDAEFVLGDSLHLITDLAVQVGTSRPYNPMQDSALPAIDARQPVYDIKGTFTLYQCTPVASGQTPFAKTHNCNKYPATAGGYGQCYTYTFGDKRCIMAGGDPTQSKISHPLLHQVPSGSAVGLLHPR